MRAILTVLRKEIRENLRERRTVISALLLGPVFVPLLFAGMLTLMLERNTDKFPPFFGAHAGSSRIVTIRNYI